MAAVVVQGMAARADGIGTEIDLTTFGKLAPETPSVWDEVPLQDVARRFGTAPRQFYISGMIGPSFAHVESPATAVLASDDTLFNAGAALGIAFERRRGRLRVEVEGMGRSTYDALYTTPPPFDPNATTILTSNWSAMGNIWRDLMITDRFGVYGGGGIGGGGYVLSDQSDGVVESHGDGTAFAWQAGGGLLWEVTQRLTFDVGYRYFQIDTVKRIATAPSDFSASELMFTLRLYEPFRNWRR